jgi:hypothetical protein
VTRMLSSKSDATDALVGQPYDVPAGAWVHSLKTGKWTQSMRKQTVVPHFVDRYIDGTVVVTWAGGGGYWRRVRIRNGKYMNHWGDSRV